jgi:hypothetical protein
VVLYIQCSSKHYSRECYIPICHKCECSYELLSWKNEAIITVFVFLRNILPHVNNDQNFLWKFWGHLDYYLPVAKDCRYLYYSGNHFFVQNPPPPTPSITGTRPFCACSGTQTTGRFPFLLARCIAQLRKTVNRTVGYAPHQTFFDFYNTKAHAVNVHKNTIFNSAFRNAGLARKNDLSRLWATTLLDRDVPVPQN